MTLLLLAAWLPARLVTCLQNARAPKRDKTGEKKKKGRAGLWERNGTERNGTAVVCACKRPENECGIVCVYIKCGEVDCAVRPLAASQ